MRECESVKRVEIQISKALVSSGFKKSIQTKNKRVG